MASTLLSQALASQDAVQIVQICQQAELDAATTGNGHPHASEHMLCLLLMDDLSEARFLWRRLPLPLRSVLGSEWALAQALWRNDRPAFFNAALQTTWPANLQPLVLALVDRVRTRAATLVSHAYSVIAVTTLIELLGISKDTVPDICATHGWRIDGDHVLCSSSTGKPLKSAAAVRQSGQVNGTSAQDVPYVELNRLTEQLVRLQTN